MISSKAKDDFKKLAQDLIKAGRIDLEGLKKATKIEEKTSAELRGETNV